MGYVSVSMNEGQLSSRDFACDGSKRLSSGSKRGESGVVKVCEILSCVLDFRDCFREKVLFFLAH